MLCAFTKEQLHLETALDVKLRGVVVLLELVNDDTVVADVGGVPATTISVDGSSALSGNEVTPARRVVASVHVH